MQKKRWWLAVISGISALFLIPLGCATQDQADGLEKRVAALEQKEKAKATADQDRQSKLESCVNVDADQEYWTYIRLNGKAVLGKPGQYTAFTSDWNEAARRKKDKIDECKLMYGPR
jgi:3-phenylpropionate/cinnamic acid dioxygenase small subunit